MELSPKGIGVLGVVLPDLARAVTIFSKVQATGKLLPDDSVPLNSSCATFSKTDTPVYTPSFVSSQKREKPQQRISCEA